MNVLLSSVADIKLVKYDLLAPVLAHKKLIKTIFTCFLGGGQLSVGTSSINNVQTSCWSVRPSQFSSSYVGQMNGRIRIQQNCIRESSLKDKKL